MLECPHTCPLGAPQNPPVASLRNQSPNEDGDSGCVSPVIQVSTQSHLRPVTPGRRLAFTAADVQGGPFGIRGVVELGDVRRCGTPLLVEDVEFRLAQAERIGRLKHGFLGLLPGVAGTRLKGILGDELERIGSNLAMLPGAGTASLGCLVPATRPQLSVNGWGKGRLTLDDTEGRYGL